MSRKRVGPAKTLIEAKAAQAQALEQLRGLPNLAGVGITSTTDGYGLKINLSSAVPEGLSLPSTISGVPVTVEVVGLIRKRI